MSRVGLSKWDWKKWYLRLKMILLSFLYILGDIRNIIIGLGKHLTGLGRACIDRTQNLRKSMKSTWVMNKSLFGFLLIKWGHIIPILYIYNLPLKFGLKQSIWKIWVFRALGSGFHSSPHEKEMDIEKNSHGFLKF